MVQEISNYIGYILNVQTTVAIFPHMTKLLWNQRQIALRKKVCIYLAITHNLAGRMWNTDSERGKYQEDIQIQKKYI